MESVDANADQVSARTLGQTLSAERERQGLSRSDAAQRLHMSAYQVEALETGDFSRLPKGTFLRGFVRNYAKILGLAPDAALALLPGDAPRDTKPGIVVPTQNIRFDPLGDRLQNPYVKAATLAVVALAIGFAAMYWWLFIRTTPPAGSAAHKSESQGQSAPVAAPVPMTSAPVASPAPAKVQEPVKPPEAPRPDAKKAEPPKAEPLKFEPKKTEPAKAEPAKAESAKPELLRVGTDGSVLKFRFKGESWVEIRDARGKVLLSRLNTAGSEAEVAGKPPFTVVVGNAPEVQLLYNDRPFDLEPHTKVAVARFTVQ